MKNLIFTAQGDKNESVRGPELKILTGIVRMRFLYRWGLILQDENELAKMPYLSYHNKSSLDIADSEFNFLPQIPNYKWVRRPIRNGYLYVFNADEKKMSEYSIVDGNLGPIAIDLMEYKANNAKTDWDKRSSNNQEYNDLWQNNEFDKKDNKLYKAMFAYSEHQWAMSYIETLLDDKYEKLRDKRFNDMDLQVYYEHFKTNPNTKENPFDDEVVAEHFSLGDHFNYFIKTGNEHNKWEEQKFGMNTITNFLISDRQTMSPPPITSTEIIVSNNPEFKQIIIQPASDANNSKQNNSNDSKNKLKPIYVHATLHDPLGAIDDIAEDLGMENATFDSLIASLNTQLSPDEILESALQELGASKEVPLSDEKKKEESKEESKEEREKREEKEIQMAVNKAIAEERKNDPVNEDYQKLFTSTLLLYKMFYTPEFETIAEVDEDIKKFEKEQKLKPGELCKKYKKYRDCLQYEKLTKILAVKEREEHRNSILKLRDSLGTMMKWLDSQVVLFDYMESIDFIIAQGKSRMASIAIQMCNPIRGKDRHLDIEFSEEKEKEFEDRVDEWNPIIFKCGFKESEDEKDATLDTFDFDSLESQGLIRALMNKTIGHNEIPPDERRAYTKTVAIAASTYVSWYKYLDTKIRMDRFSIQNEITANQGQIDENTQARDNAQRDVDASNRQIEKAENRKNKTQANIDKSAEGKALNQKKLADLQKLEKQFLQQMQNNISANNDGRKAIEIRDLTLEDIENDISKNSVYAEHSSRKSVSIFGKQIEEYNKQISEIEEQNKNTNKEIADRKAEIDRLEREKVKITKEQKHTRNKVNRADTKIENKNESIRQIDHQINGHNEVIRQRQGEINTRNSQLNELNGHRARLNARYNEIKGVKVKGFFFRKPTFDVIGDVFNSAEFQGAMLILSVVSLIDIYVKISKEDSVKARDLTTATGHIADFGNIVSDIVASLKRHQVKSFSSRMGISSKSLIRGAAKVSIAFSTISAISGTVGAAMDMHASIKREDQNATIGNCVAVILGTLSSLASLTLLMGSLNIVSLSTALINTLVLCNIWFMLLMVAALIIVALICDDDFQSFLRATIFSGKREIPKIGDLTPYEVKYELSSKRNYYARIYEEDLYNFSFEADNKGGKREKKKRGVDLRDFDNMLAWIYNLMTGFSGLVNLNSWNDRFTYNKQKMQYPTNLNFDLIFGGYSKESGDYEYSFEIYPRGVVDSKPIRLGPSNTQDIEYRNKKNYINPNLGWGINLQYDIKSIMDDLKEKEQLTDMTRYVLFFRIIINKATELSWPYMRSNEKESLYIAFSEIITRSTLKNTSRFFNVEFYQRLSLYSSKDRGARFMIQDKAILIGNYNEILDQIEEWENSYLLK